MLYATAPSQRRFNPARTLRIPTLVALLALTTACGQPETSSDGIFTPELTHTAALPPSLVERQVGADDADGVPDRALDWYDIGEIN